MVTTRTYEHGVASENMSAEVCWRAEIELPRRGLQCFSNASIVFDASRSRLPKSSCLRVCLTRVFLALLFFNKTFFQDLLQTLERMMKIHLILIVIIIGLFACSTVSVVQKNATQKNLDWLYEGEKGPEFWGSLMRSYSLCANGQSQSPINISDEKDLGLKPIRFQYGKSQKATVINDGHTIQINYGPGSHAQIGGKNFELLQIQFHSPSEHQIHGNYADMVAHLVHQARDGQLAIVAVMFNRGAENRFLKPVWRTIPRDMGEERIASTLDVNDLLPKDKTFFTYSGSLTMPPCTENVNWNIFTEHMTVSDEQISLFRQLFPHNTRPIQLRNSRLISIVY